MSLYFFGYKDIQADLRLISASNNSCGALALQLVELDMTGVDIDAQIRIVKDSSSANPYIETRIFYQDSPDHWTTLHSTNLGSASYNTDYTFRIVRNGNTVYFSIDGTNFADSYTVDSSILISHITGEATILTETSEGSHIVMTADNFIAKDPSF